MKALNFKQVYARVSPWALPFLVVLFLLSLFTCNRQRGAVADLRLDLDSVARLARHFENEKGQVITENQVLKAEGARQIQDLTDTIFNLKKEDRKKIKQIQDYTRIIQQFKTDPKFAPFTDSDFLELVKKDSTQTAVTPAHATDSNYIRVPRPFMFWDSTVRFAGRVTLRGVWLDSIRIENSLHFRTVIEKTGFMNMGRKTSVQVLNSNPAITTMGVTKIETGNKPNWWNKWGKLVAGAVLGGIGVHQITH